MSEVFTKQDVIDIPRCSVMEEGLHDWRVMNVGTYMPILWAYCTGCLIMRTVNGPGHKEYTVDEIIGAAPA